MARAIVAVLGGLSLAAASSLPDGLPAHLTGYRAWRAGDVHAVSIPLSILCVALPEKELARRREEALRAHGPHAERYLRVFANPVAAKAARETIATREFPQGSILAKEKLLDPYATKAEGVAFMIKRAPGTFPKSNDWEFRYYPEPRGASYSGCIECHRTGASKDYVFSRLEKAAQQ
jgi:hypothetical protein